MHPVYIIGAGLAGLSAALTLAEQGRPSVLVSLQPSERAQSVLAEGGINAALDTMGEGDTVEDHYNDTLRGGVWLADPNAVAALTAGAPDVVRRLAAMGVPFNREDGHIVQRNFGGQKHKRTAYARSSTGKILMNAVIDVVRRHEAAGLVTRLPHHECLRLLTEEGRCIGVRIRDTYTGAMTDGFGRVILCTGGLCGLFPGHTTGTTQNTGDVTAMAFSLGAALAGLEMLQYHPTTVGIAGKRCLVTEAARGEGGRLCIRRDGALWYFMEEKYPELKNLMPRDVVAREMYFVRRDLGGSVLLDMTSLPEATWENKLSDLREELMHYLSLDPKKDLIPVEEGIHYFMGGIDTDIGHRTSLPGLYAAGECACQYHGANRLGGNSLLGALFGGQTAAQSVMGDVHDDDDVPAPRPFTGEEPLAAPVSAAFAEAVCEILLGGMGIVRSEAGLTAALDALSALTPGNARERCRLRLAEAMLTAARARRESRGAHYREDWPQTDESFRKTAVAEMQGDAVTITFRPLPERRETS